MNRTRTPIVVGNWKMHTTLAQARELVQSLRDTLDGVPGVTVVLCPSFVSLETVRWELDGSSLKMGAQNMHPETQGAFTGEVSPAMLAALCEYVILGHSERRAQFGETDDFVNRKVRAALAHGLQPILCVGETLEENEAGRTEEKVGRQVRGGLKEVPSLEEVVVAYEPVWAIGTSRAATPEGANAVMDLIRRTLAEMYDLEVAGRTPILYGGSVTPQNAGSLFHETEIDGALVGGASLRAEDFGYIVQQAALTAARVARR